MSISESSYWAVARTQSKREDFAAEHIAAAGFQVFAPKVRERVDARWRVAPLFRTYIFVRVVEQWRILERTLGVVRLIKFGDSPAHCPNAEVEALLARADSSGVIRLPDRPPVAPKRMKVTPGCRGVTVNSCSSIR